MLARLCSPNGICFLPRTNREAHRIDHPLSSSSSHVEDRDAPGARGRAGKQRKRAIGQPPGGQAAGRRVVVTYDVGRIYGRVRCSSCQAAGSDL